ncbi:sodium transporter [Chryseobacterium lactis]|uniref:Sodium transporter n=1 Tax=Chryseobacterium lactis TaxID=1241981 RepID=A0A3G6RRW0_CHRLC|nr:sodium/solute symporter [Chryseobacterium lactis]AZA80998.1 sodium transporter [Chryseobacterium lactis]AZB05999.1 sodium transporter [Chryseobacterium lactis]PNW10931.1 sodium transporter [Chryseobacterium lactis]
MNKLTTIDYIVFTLYFVTIVIYGIYIFNRKRKKEADSKDYFLAEGSLTWWAIGASLIASNISAEQFIGMSGSGFSMGLAIATYEWMAAFTLIIVAVFFIPVYLKNKIYTMPQYLHKRYNEKVALIMSVFWLMLYIVVNLTSILYLGALALNGISGFNLTLCMSFLAIFAIMITLGGMKVIGYTDVIQVFFLILGGLVTTYLAVTMISEGKDLSSFAKGLTSMRKLADDHFHMIFRKTDPHYIDLPGISVLIGGMLIVNLNYWGCNQYITQRALGADLKTARNGILFAAFLKLLMPVIVVLPGIAAYILYQKGLFQQEMLQDGSLNPDRAYPTLLNLLPSGLKGLSFAALTAAIVASLAGKANSIATIFTLDIYKQYIKKDASENKLVQIGKFAVVVSIILAVIIAPFLGIDRKGGFQYIQEYTGFVSPGVFAMFILGFFWKKTTPNAALFAIIAGFIFSIGLKFVPLFVDLSFLYPVNFAVPNAEGVYEIAFIDRMAVVFLFCVLGMYIISIKETRQGLKTNALKIDYSMFRVDKTFAIGSILIIIILIILYTWFR